MRIVFGLLAMALGLSAVTMFALGLSSLGWCMTVAAWICASVANINPERRLYLARRYHVPPTDGGPDA